MESLHDEIARTIRDRRRQRGMNQTDLASLAGVGRRFVSDLENGKPTLRVEQIQRVLEVFGLRLSVRPLEREA